MTRPVDRVAIEALRVELEADRVPSVELLSKALGKEPEAV